MTLTTIAVNATDPVQFICNIDQANNNWMILTILLFVGIVLAIGTFVWKRDLIISATSALLVTAFVALGFRIITCDLGYILASSKIVISLFIGAAICTAIIVIQKRNEG